jgi:hypothetical protein
MKKLIVIIIVLLSIVYFAYGIFQSEENTIMTNESSFETDFEIIQPPTLIQANNAKNEDLVPTGKKRAEISNQYENLAEKQALTKSTRKQLSDLYKSKNVNYTTLGEMLDKIQAQSHNSQEVSSQFERIKHNLELAKKIAALTKRLHVDKGGNRKVLDQTILDELLVLQKQLILPLNNIDFDSENNNAKD